MSGWLHHTWLYVHFINGRESLVTAHSILPIEEVGSKFRLERGSDFSTMRQLYIDFLALGLVGFRFTINKPPLVPTFLSRRIFLYRILLSGVVTFLSTSVELRTKVYIIIKEHCYIIFSRSSTSSCQ
jgi:hypothetical protein